ncbi:MAG: hypothetical protein K6C69_05700 [Lachnospiraceae bacterium]|nr:hypothetical protein [Lachnospiraceae bacterium]
MAYRDVFDRGLRHAKQNVQLAATYGFHSEALVASMVDALNILAQQGHQNSRESVYMFEDALSAVEEAVQELESQHRRRVADFKDEFESEKFVDENDPIFVETVHELEDYCEDYGYCIDLILDAFEDIFKICGNERIWMPIVERIIDDVTKFATKAYTTFALPSGATYKVVGSDRPANLLTRWDDIHDELERRIQIEIEREERERKEREERERREAELRAERERREREERERREREEREEAERRAAAEEAEKIRRENERLEAEYSEFVVNTNIKIDQLTEEQAGVRAEYEAFQEEVGGKIAEQEEDERYLETLLGNKKSLADELENLREERTEKAGQMANLGVLQMNEKKQLKLEIDHLDQKIDERDQKLRSYSSEIDAVERRIRSKDAGGKSKLKAYESRLNEFDEQIAALRKEIEDKKPMHMR